MGKESKEGGKGCKKKGQEKEREMREMGREKDDR